MTSALFLCACQTMPDAYAPPVQRLPFENVRPYRSPRFIMMADGDADFRIVRDIPAHAEGVWRWTGQHPTVRIPEGPNRDLRYVMDFALPNVTFASTGPVTLSFYVNDHLLDRVRYTTSGSKHFEKAIPPDWLEEGKEALASAEIDKVYTAQDDGVRLGFILVGMGFKEP